MAINDYANDFEQYTYNDQSSVTPSLAQTNQLVATKQNAVAIQPSTPPLNPNINDMWIDNNIYPNVVYTWDGTQWNRATTINASEVGAYTTAQVDTTTNNIQMDLDATKTRVTNVEQNTTSTAIVNTVTSSVPWQGLLTQSSAASTYATQSALTQQANNLTAQFSLGGGINMLQNSVGYGGMTHWQNISGTFNQYVGNDCPDTPSGFTAVTGDMQQAVLAIAGQPYTVTCKVKKGTAGSGYLKISDGNTFQQINIIATQAYNYTTIQYAGFVPANNTVIIELQASGVTGGLIFTSLMLNIGSVGYTWSNALGELYNTSVLMDVNGIQVNSNVYTGYTIMSPSEFSGYYLNTQGVMQKVFTLNKDTTQVAKIAINDPTAPEIDMGNLKMLNVNTGGFNGWAIVPAT